jgi:hypothetical protein
MHLKRAQNLLRESLHYRSEAFASGLQAAGFSVVKLIADPTPEDLLLTWNRYSRFDVEACRFEAAGARVVVVENGYLSKSWRGGNWFSMALGHHAGAGTWNVGGPERWDAIGAEIAPWRTEGETVILGQRAIGERGIASPDGWAESVQRRIGGRIRQHPGKYQPAVSLEQDLRTAGQVVTWASSAALLALIAGVPVWYGFDRWIGAQAGLPLALYGAEPKRSDADRLAMFRRLAWAMWTLEEIRDGRAFDHLLRV